ncbi:MAG: hypothetical protein ACI8TQ_003646 [Planctomycetota bacterium]
MGTRRFLPLLRLIQTRPRLGTTVRHDCQARLSGKTVRHDCQARLSGKTARHDCATSPIRPIHLCES